MKTCWQVLGIEATTDTDAIRQAYLALLPSFHPETDPQGFKLLREAYENALQGTTSPAITVVDEDPDTPWVNYLGEIFRDLLADEERRFQPQAWQEFIQQINKLSITQAEKARWLLCDIAMQTFPVSYSCMNLLSQRLSWEQRDCNEEMDRERLDNFLSYVEHGDMFDYALLLNIPPEVQNQTWRFMMPWTTPFSSILSISPNLWPSTARGLSRTICAFTDACYAGSAPCILASRSCCPSP